MASGASPIAYIHYEMALPQTLAHKIIEVLLVLQLEAQFAAAYLDNPTLSYTTSKNRRLELYPHKIFMESTPRGIHSAVVTLLNTTAASKRWITRD